MRALVLLVAACSFHTHALTGDGATTSDAPTDADGAAVDAAADGSAGPFCDLADLDLRACFTFDGSVHDGSYYAHSTSTSNVSYTAGHDGQAAALGPTSGISVTGNESSFDISLFTMKMWINPSSLPADGLRMGLLDSGNRYRMFLEPGGQLRCAITGGPDLYSGSHFVQTGVWQRVACTFDGTTTTIYVDGAVAGSVVQAATINTSSSGLVIGENNPSGDNFEGAIDDLQLWGSIVAP
jgi:hypothetical protein